MTVRELIATLGGGALVGWVAKVLTAREGRLRAQAVAAAETEKARITTTGETDVAALRMMEQTGQHALRLAEQERDRLWRQQLMHTECLAKVEHLQTRLEMIEAEHAGCPERIERLERSIEAMARALTDRGVLPTLEEP